MVSDGTDPAGSTTENFLISCVTGSRFEVFTALKIQVTVFWAVTLCDVVVGYQPFGEPCCFRTTTTTTTTTNATSAAATTDCLVLHVGIT